MTDAPGRSERFGEERLIETIRTHDPADTALAGMVLEAVDRFLATTQPDDIAVISMVREHSASPPESAAA